MSRNKIHYLSMAKNECANWVDAACVTTKDGICLLSLKQQCKYFEHSVLPLATKYGPKYSGAAEQYHNDIIGGSKQIHAKDVEEVLTFKARNCGCGEILLPNKHLCENCRKKNLKASQKKAALKIKNKA